MAYKKTKTRKLREAIEDSPSYSPTYSPSYSPNYSLSLSPGSENFGDENIPESNDELYDISHILPRIEENIKIILKKNRKKKRRFNSENDVFPIRNGKHYEDIKRRMKNEEGFEKSLKRYLYNRKPKRNDLGHRQEIFRSLFNDNFLNEYTIKTQSFVKKYVMDEEIFQILFKTWSDDEFQYDAYLVFLDNQFRRLGYRVNMKRFKENRMNLLK